MVFQRGINIALCGYPHVKVSIRDLGQFSTTASIFQQYNYFRQNSEENVTFTFYFSSFTSNFPCKILWDNRNIAANILIFQITFWQWCLPLTKNYFEVFFWPQSDLLVCRISTLSDTSNRFFANKYHIFCKYLVGIFFNKFLRVFHQLKVELSDLGENWAKTSPLLLQICESSNCVDSHIVHSTNPSLL